MRLGKSCFCHMDREFPTAGEKAEKPWRLLVCRINQLCTRVTIKMALRGWGEEETQNEEDRRGLVRSQLQDSLGII